MKVYFCPVPIEEHQKGNNGIAYASNHKSEWVEGTGLLDYIAAGWVKGVDYVLLNGKCYYLIASYMHPNKDYVIHLCIEDDKGRKNYLTEDQWNNL